MVSVKRNGSHIVHRGGGGYGWPSSSLSSASTSSTSALTPPPPQKLTTNNALSGISLSPHSPRHQRRLLVATLLGTFVFVTMVVPMLRFLQYDDSHLLQSLLLLDTQGTASSKFKTTDSPSVVSLLDVALGKAPISDYHHGTSVSSSVQSSQPDRSDSTTPKKTLLLRHTPDDATTDDPTEPEEGREPDDSRVSNEHDKGHDPHQEEHEDELDIHPTERIIPPFSWEQQLTNANRYRQSFSHVGRTATKTSTSKPNHRRSNTDSLLFFHIPKTAGTAIEYAAGMNPDRPLAWGSCRFNHTPKRDICHYPKHSKPWPQHVGWWHLPVQLFPIANRNPYENAELFGVVRDPYDRMVSEFYYICTLKVMTWRPDQCDRSRLTDVTYMNEWLRQKIRNRETDSGRSYLIDNGHFTPQYDYIFGPNQVRMLDYVLFMDSDHFNDDFATLMNAYELPNVQLKKLNALGATERGSDHFDTTHLDTKTIQWIHNMYPDDFAIGGYEKKVI